MLATNAFAIVWIVLGVIVAIPILLVVIWVILLLRAQKRYEQGKGSNPWA